MESHQGSCRMKKAMLRKCVRCAARCAMIVRKAEGAEVLAERVWEQAMTIRGRLERMPCRGRVANHGTNGSHAFADKNKWC